MKKKTLLNKIITKIERKKISKREMCEKAIKSNVCPHRCDICAWNDN